MSDEKKVGELRDEIFKLTYCPLNECLKIALFILAREASLRDEVKRLEQEVERVKKENEDIINILGASRNLYGRTSQESKDLWNMWCKRREEALAPKEKP